MKTPHVYCICYLENKFYEGIESELIEKGYTQCKAIIPTVSILTKTSRSKDVYRKVPLLFNYGFIKMPTELAFNRDFMNKMKRDIDGIRGWVKSPESLHPKKKKLRIDNMDIFDDFSIVATATREEVRRFKRLSRENKRFSIDNLMNLKVGDYLVLKGYPYDGIDANILEVNHTTKMVKLLLFPENGKMEISLPFDSVIYSVYQNYDPDDLLVNRKNYDESKITEESVKNVLDFRQY